MQQWLFCKTSSHNEFYIWSNLDPRLWIDHKTLGMLYGFQAVQVVNQKS